ncbi:MAG TPA: hypothetical protein VNQ76_07455 [Planctomicrobium sp.]|nr:hypothetical protein [Planctomicrobium sp.]
MSPQSHPSFSTEIDALVEAALAGQLSNEEQLRLDESLRTSPKFRKAYLEAMQIHLDLNRLSEQMEWPGKNFSLTPSPGVSSFWKKTLLAIGCCVAVALLVVVSQRLWIPQRQHDQGTGALAVTPVENTTATDSESIIDPPVVADRPPIVVDAAQAIFFGEGLVPTSGRELFLKKRYVLTQGMLSLEFVTGARTILKAPSIFTVVGPATIQMHSGHCSVHAPPGAEGFQVLSPTAEVVDLGTRFVVNVAQTGETELQVVDGMASLVATEGTPRAPILLKEGESIKVESGITPVPSSKSSGKSTYLEHLPDRVVQYQATQSSEGLADELLSVVVQRGGIPREYSRDKLIRSRLTHLSCVPAGGGLCLPQGADLPQGQDRHALLDEDWSLVTGIANPRMAVDEEAIHPDKAVMTVEFSSPIVNGPGPDILVFDLHLLVQSPAGNQFRVRSGDANGPKSIFLINQFDLGLNSPYALDLTPYRLWRNATAIHSVEDLLTAEFVLHGSQVHVDTKALVVGIDLSDLGYKPGESLTRLDFLSVPRSQDVDAIDPVLIVGLPELPDERK